MTHALSSGPIVVKWEGARGNTATAQDGGDWGVKVIGASTEGIRKGKVEMGGRTEWE